MSGDESSTAGSTDGREQRGGPPRWAIALIVVGLSMALIIVVVVLVSGDDDDDESQSSTTPVPTSTVDGATTTTASATTEAPTTTVFAVREGAVGESLPISAEGAIARVNAVMSDAPPRSELSPPSPGTSFTEIEVELCAGEGRLLVDPALWSGTLDSGAPADATLTGNDLATVGLAPGGCARGWVALEVDDGATLDEIVLVDDGFDVRARWSTAGAVAPTGRLSTPVDVVAVALETPIALDAGTATVVAVSSADDVADIPPAPGRELVELDVEVCAGDDEVVADPFLWAVVTDDSYIASVDLASGTPPDGPIAPGTCLAGAVVVDSLAGSTPRWALVLDADLDELGRIEF